MNIFYVDSDPVIAAQSLCDKHVVKMILESCQLMCTAHHLYAAGTPYYTGFYCIDENLLYKKTHVNHPCTKWIQCYYNYHWVADHCLALCDEYTLRYEKIHKCTELAKTLKENYPLYKFGGPTEPVQAMPDECKIEGNPVEAYRKYYNTVKRNTIQMTWKKRQPPEWYK
jgi:hypothetical protein